MEPHVGTLLMEPTCGFLSYTMEPNVGTLVDTIEPHVGILVTQWIHMWVP